jgi:hypothetical protein
MERAEINRNIGRRLIEDVNQALKEGKSVDANTYFEAITESEDVGNFRQSDWPRDEATDIYNRSVGSNRPLGENNQSLRDVVRKSK